MHLPLCGSAIPMDLVLSLELGLPLNSITAKNPNFSGTTEWRATEENGSSRVFGPVLELEI